MKRFAIIACVAAVLLGVALKGTFGHTLFVLCTGIYLGLPFALFLLLWLVIGLGRTGSVPEGLKKTLLVSAILSICLLLSLGIGYYYVSATGTWVRFD